MDGSLKDLSLYRISRAKEDLKTAEDNLSQGSYKASLNRSYYAIFHAMRAVTTLDHFDSSKHSGVIAFFNMTYVKTGIFDKSISKIIDSSFRLREKADYDDFFLASKEDAALQIERAKQVISLIENYINSKTI